jgi:hypothetical protein
VVAKPFGIVESRSVCFMRLRRIPIPRAPVNKSKKEGQEP